MKRFSLFASLLGLAMLFFPLASGAQDPAFMSGGIADGPPQISLPSCLNAFNCAINKFRGFAAQSGANVEADPSSIIGNIVGTAVGVLGVVAVGLIIYSGGLWITAAGRDDQVEKAKSIIKTTVIGIVVLGLAYAIVMFVVSFVTF